VLPRPLAELLAAAGAGAGDLPRLAAVIVDGLGPLALDTREGATDATISGWYEAHLEATLTAAARKAQSAYLTPRRLVEAQLDALAAAGGLAAGGPAIDTACGTGEWLVALADRGDLAVDQLWGIDIDPWAVAITRTRLIARALRTGVAAAGIAGRVRLGDALRDACGDDLAGRFGLVVGNPPFGNAIEAPTRRRIDERLALRQRFTHAATGAFDRSMLFVELGLGLLREGGSARLLVPRASLSARYAGALRQHWRRGFEVAAFEAIEGATHFDHASVYVGAWSGTRWRASATPAPGAEEPPALQGRLGARLSTARWATWEPLSTRFGFEAGATAEEAYALRPHVSDAGDADAFWLVTTGAIDPHRLRTDRPQRYLGGRFEAPRLPRAAAGRRAALYARPKVLVAGLSRVLEALLDDEGGLAPAVAVVAATALTPDASLPRLAAWLNGWIPRLRHLDEHGPQALEGGSVVVGKVALRQQRAPAAWWVAPATGAPPAPALACLLPSVHPPADADLEALRRQAEPLLDVAPGCWAAWLDGTTAAADPEAIRAVADTWQMALAMGAAGG
jgi:predicted RNA methylase